jgi:hypothetical protein
MEKLTLKSETMKNKFGALYEDIDLNKSRAIQSSFIFIFRRLLYVASIIFFQGYGIIQIIQFTYLSASTIMFYIFVRPQQNNLSLGKEIFNEGMILASGVLGFWQTDFNSDWELTKRAGKGQIYIVCLVIILNLLLILMIQIYEMI